ncbi:MAG: excinuclease ABC subunit B, partial [Clostridiales bacterium]|nr:excinuclease ABC subunit B [Clostridiales bacterium]
RISQIEVVTGKAINHMLHVGIFPASHYATDKSKMEEGIVHIEQDLEKQLAYFEKEGKLLEAQRLSQRTNYDVEMMRELGYCTGIENYSRYFDGRSPGQTPFTLLDFFPEDYLLFIDESHVTVPQIRAMYRGDRARKENLVEYGFRLPSALDNRPLFFEEFEARVNQTVYVSATPGPYELDKTQQTVEQIIRPTGLLDPEVILRPATGQVDDLVGEINKVTQQGYRVLVTTLTKRMAESLTDYLKELEIRVRYLHSDIETMERTELIRDLRLGEFDVLVGINLLREGLDLPEVALVAILDADKEGFLRSQTSLIQTVGRAARNVEGRVIMYADRMTDSMMKAISETNRRRALQQAYNEAHGITPQSVQSTVQALLEITKKVAAHAPEEMTAEEKAELMIKLEDQMLSAAKDLDFEKAASLRDELFQLQGEGRENPSGSSTQKTQKNRKKRKSNR